jgi:opacity protein-like surface antigen
MFRHTFLGVLASAAMLATASPARAQRVGDSHIGLSGGATFPADAFTDDADAGYQFSVHYQTAVGRKMRIRIGADISRFVIPNMGRGHWLLAGGMAQAVIPIHISATVKPYLLGGVGATRVTLDIDSIPATSDTRLTYGGGVGYDFRIMGTTWFTEARYLSVRTKDVDGHSLDHIPVVLGFRF